MKLVCGIDEAGRGPVIGPLVIAGVLVDEKHLDKLKDDGIKDSKLLSPSQRKKLFDHVKKSVKDYKIIIVLPAEIDKAVEKNNLNWLEADKSIEIINALKPEKAMLDCPSNNVSAYKNYVYERLDNKNIALHSEHKADLNHVEVAAASILAKVTRDSEIEKIHKKIGIDFGSGYPADPKTKEFLVKYHNKYPDIFRKSWASYKNIANKESQSGLSSFK